MLFSQHNDLLTRAFIMSNNDQIIITRPVRDRANQEIECNVLFFSPQIGRGPIT